MSPCSSCQNAKSLKLYFILFYFLCRYHYNVADVRLSQHIEKGYEDGLFISSVACCSNLWALIMDAGTGFTAQVHELSPYFLHKVELCFGLMQLSILGIMCLMSVISCLHLLQCILYHI